MLRRKDQNAAFNIPSRSQRPEADVYQFNAQNSREFDEYRDDESENREESISWNGEVINAMHDLIQERRYANAEESYTALLFSLGRNEIARRLIDEAGGLAVALSNFSSDQEVANEAADVIYHAMVALESAGVPLNQVCDQLALRIRDSGADIEFNRIADEYEEEFQANELHRPRYDAHQEPIAQHQMSNRRYQPERAQNYRAYQDENVRYSSCDMARENEQCEREEYNTHPRAVPAAPRKKARPAVRNAAVKRKVKKS